MTTAGLLAALLPTGSAAAASAATKEFPAGDVHVDDGLRLRQGSEGGLDLLGIDVAWVDEGLRASIRLADEALPSSRTVADGDVNVHYGLTFRSSDDNYREGQQAAHSFSLSMGDFGVRANSSDEAFEDCASTQTSPIDGRSLHVLVPAACLPADVEEFWFRGSVDVSQFNSVTGDYLRGGDIAVDQSFLSFGSVQRPGTDGGVTLVADDSTHTPTPERDDSDSSDSRLVLDLGQDPGNGAADVHTVIATTPAQGPTVVEIRGASGMEHGTADLDLRNFDTDEGLSVGVNRFYDYATGTYVLEADARYSRSRDWGTRSCSASLTQTDDTYRLELGHDCDVRGPFTDYWFTARPLSADGSPDYSTQTEDWQGEASLATRPGTPGTRPAATARDYSPTCDGREPQTQFSDVAAGNPHRPAIECLSAFEITQGKGGGLYGPNESLSHGQIATFLVRTLEAAGVELPADDGECTGAHGDNLRRLQLAYISPTFDCERGYEVTRSLMAEYSRNTMEYVTKTQLEPGQDWFVDDDQYWPLRASAHNVIADAGIVTGRTAGELGPDLLLSRAQMATFLARLLDWSMANKA